MKTPENSGANADRSFRGSEAFVYYATEVNESDAQNQDDLDTLTDLLTDLVHFAVRSNMHDDPELLLARVLNHYNEEKAEDNHPE